jgi:hypothetical protein
MSERSRDRWLVVLAVVLVALVSVRLLAPVPGRAEPPRAVVYKVIEVKPLQRHGQDLEATLNTLGRDGWHVNAVLPLLDLVILEREEGL